MEPEPEEEPEIIEEILIPAPKRRPGRPKGSLNKKTKEHVYVEQSIQDAEEVTTPPIEKKKPRKKNPPPAPSSSSEEEVAPLKMPRKKPRVVKVEPMSPRGKVEMQQQRQMTYLEALTSGLRELQAERTMMRANRYDMFFKR